MPPPKRTGALHHHRLWEMVEIAVPADALYQHVLITEERKF